VTSTLDSFRYGRSYSRMARGSRKCLDHVSPNLLKLRVTLLFSKTFSAFTDLPKCQFKPLQLF
jgi:hypothetical protein